MLHPLFGVSPLLGLVVMQVATCPFFLSKKPYYLELLVSYRGSVLLQMYKLRQTQAIVRIKKETLLEDFEDLEGQVKRSRDQL